MENIESPTAVYCGLMKYNGLLMDETAMIRKQGECAARLLELREKIHAMTGDVEIGANAGTQAFKDYLFKTLGLPVLKTTAKNAEAADDQTMVMLAEWCAEHRPELVPLFELVQEYRKWSKLKTTYIDGYGTATEVHGNNAQCGTAAEVHGCRSCRITAMAGRGFASDRHQRQIATSRHGRWFFDTNTRRIFP